MSVNFDEGTYGKYYQCYKASLKKLEDNKNWLECPLALQTSLTQKFQ